MNSFYYKKPFLKTIKLAPILFLVVVIFVSKNGYSQQNKPKVALVLSGGGAKGVAHIPVLQALDSLGIVPDLVVGTSMGAITGGLYAMGYSGDSIAGIVKDINWETLLDGHSKLSAVSVEEKSEFNKYLISLDIIKGKPKPVSALLNDQNLREYLSTLTYAAYNIKDFNNFPIPFIAVAADIVNGEEVIIREGNLDVAMRASMSIPGAFEPVLYKDKLVVDGGMLNNFPTDIAKKMGATIIIGSDVSGGKLEKDKLDNIADILMQAAMVVHNKKFPKNKELCTIFINHEPNLTHETQDFENTDDIYLEGKIATASNLNALVALAEKLKKYPQRKVALLKVKDTLVLDTIVYTNISKANLSLVKERTNIKTQTPYTVPQIISGIDRAMGTNIFNKITYNPVIINNKKGLEINGVEKSKHQIKTALHYDTYRGVGLIGSYSGRNVLGNASRLMLNLDIAEQPKALLEYQQNIGSKKQWWWRSSSLYQYLKQKIFFQGKTAANIRESSWYLGGEVNRNLNPVKSYIGFGIHYLYSELKPDVAPEINENALTLEHYFYNNTQLDFHFNSNNFNTVFYATKGRKIKAAISRSIMQKANISYSDPDLEDFNGNTNGYTQVNFTWEERISINSKLTGIISAGAGFTFEDSLKNNETSFYELGYAGMYFLGGNINFPRKNRFAFEGLNEDEVIGSQLMIVRLGLQIKPVNQLFITPHINIGSVGESDFGSYMEGAFSPEGNWEENEYASGISTIGATFSYNSLLGPINFDVSWANDINDIRLFFNIGIPFNR